MHWPAKVVDSLSFSICWRSLKKLFAAAITVYDYDRQSETFHVVAVGGHHAQFILQRDKDIIKEQERTRKAPLRGCCSNSYDRTLITSLALAYLISFWQSKAPPPREHTPLSLSYWVSLFSICYIISYLLPNPSISHLSHSQPPLPPPLFNIATIFDALVSITIYRTIWLN